VIYICEHSDDGGMGIVVNRPMDVSMGDIFSEVKIKDANPQAAEPFALCGGPMQVERGFVIHPFDDQWQSSLHVEDKISVTTSIDILEALAHGGGPKEHCVALGYAAWEPGQLEQELLANDWLTCEADDAILFHVPFKQRWEACAQLLGVNIHTISPESGNA